MSAALRPEPNPGYLRIATEEAYALPEMYELFRSQLRDGSVDDPGFRSLVGHYALSPGAHPRSVLEKLQDAGELRIADMDGAGIDHQVMALTAPGTQMMSAPDARRIASLANDRLAEACSLHPDRFSALAAVAYQDPEAAVRELRRGVLELGLKGVILNSHINGEYIDDPKFFPILEAVAELGVPIYLHPTAPPASMIAPFLEAGLDGSIYGFGVETGLHLLRIVTSGIFDRLPTLKLVVGHLGEALPFWLHRIDNRYDKQIGAGRYEFLKPLEMKPSEYFRRNIWITTSGMPWAPAIMFTREVVGADRVMYAMDYPYQFDASEVAAQDNLPIGPGEKKAFFETTARDVFGLSF
ncbi:MAG: amidohydrolase family protein [Arthrobacter sp.]|uniref:amidohydrolase family protein n=1 Tax=Arthrobacter sp. TaxID=1667 RepID=UPI003482A3FC